MKKLDFLFTDIMKKLAILFIIYLLLVMFWHLMFLAGAVKAEDTLVLQNNRTLEIFEQSDTGMASFYNNSIVGDSAYFGIQTDTNTYIYTNNYDITYFAYFKDIDPICVQISNLEFEYRQLKDNIEMVYNIKATEQGDIKTFFVRVR